MHTAHHNFVFHGNVAGVAQQLHALSAFADAHEQFPASAKEIEQLHRAVESRDVIGQAGMLVERFNIGAAAAFDLLRRLSQDSNVRVEIIASRLIQSEHPEP